MPYPKPGHKGSHRWCQTGREKLSSRPNAKHLAPCKCFTVRSRNMEVSFSRCFQCGHSAPDSPTKAKVPNTESQHDHSIPESPTKGKIPKALQQPTPKPLTAASLSSISTCYTRTTLQWRILRAARKYSSYVCQYSIE